MSINQYSSDISETPWWSTRQQQSSLMEPSIQNASSCGPPIHPSWPTQTQVYQYHHHHQPPCVMNRGFNLNNQDEELEEEEEEEEEQVENGRFWGSRGEEEEEETEKEAMFEKALTPSDVGKLNRLVIPKQQAEKYFPLSDSGGENNKGVLLSFEDESCKSWRFRYSYWNSSQSYVLTKGWSRYVKDKRLLAGDVVSFLRLRSLPHRLFISFRRRHTPPAPMPLPIAAATKADNDNTKAVGVSLGWTTTPFYSAHPYPTLQPFPFPPHIQPLHAPAPPPGRETESEKQIPGNSSKVLRLFGVNMECQTEPDDDSGSSRPEHLATHVMSSSTRHHFYHYHHLHPSYAHNPPHRHMDVNQMRNRPG